MSRDSTDYKVLPTGHYLVMESQLNRIMSLINTKLNMLNYHQQLFQSFNELAESYNEPDLTC